MRLSSIILCLAPPAMAQANSCQRKLDNWCDSNANAQRGCAGWTYPFARYDKNVGWECWVGENGAIKGDHCVTKNKEFESCSAGGGPKKCSSTKLHQEIAKIVAEDKVACPDPDAGNSGGVPAADCKQKLLDEYCKTTASALPLCGGKSFRYARKPSQVDGPDWTCFESVETVESADGLHCVDNDGNMVICKEGKGDKCKQDSELLKIVQADNCQAAANSAPADCKQKWMDDWCKRATGLTGSGCVKGQAYSFARINAYNGKFACFQRTFSTEQAACVDREGKTVNCDRGDGRRCTAHYGQLNTMKDACIDQCRNSPDEPAGGQVSKKDGPIQPSGNPVMDIADIPKLYRRFSLEFWVKPTGMCSDSVRGCTLFTLGEDGKAPQAEVLMTTSTDPVEKAELKFEYTTTDKVKPDAGPKQSAGQFITAPISIKLHATEYTKISIHLKKDETKFTLEIAKDDGINTDGSTGKASVEYDVPCIYDNVLLENVKLKAADTAGEVAKAMLKNITLSTDSCAFAQKWNPKTNKCENKGGLKDDAVNNCVQSQMDAHCKSIGKTDCADLLSEETLLPYARYKDGDGYYCYEDVNTSKTGNHCRKPGRDVYNMHTIQAKCFEGSGAECMSEDYALLQMTKKDCSEPMLWANLTECSQECGNGTLTQRSLRPQEGSYPLAYKYRKVSCNEEACTKGSEYRSCPKSHPFAYGASGTNCCDALPTEFGTKCANSRQCDESDSTARCFTLPQCKEDSDCDDNAKCKASTDGSYNGKFCECNAPLYAGSGLKGKCTEKPEGLCKNTECWTWDKAARSCNMKAECMKVTCNHDSMEIAAKSKLFGLTDADPAKVSPVPDLVTPGADGFDFKKTCKLGECEMTYKIEDEMLVFTMILREKDQDGFTNTVDTSANALTVNSNPLAIAVPFTCKYPVDVKLSSEEFNLKDVVLGAGPSNEGNLATGFDLTLDAGVDDPIKLGDRQEVKATWKVTALKDVFFNFTGCTVTQDDNEVALVKNFCFSKALKVTPAEGSATVQAFSYQTFSSVGATSTSQTISCDVKICMDDYHLPKEDAKCLKDDETDFGPYDFTVAGYSADGTQGGGDAGDAGAKDAGAEKKPCPDKKRWLHENGGTQYCCSVINCQSVIKFGMKNFFETCPHAEGCTGATIQPCPSDKPYLFELVNGDNCCKLNNKEECKKAWNYGSNDKSVIIDCPQGNGGCTAGDAGDAGGDAGAGDAGAIDADAGPKPCPSEKPYLGSYATGDWCCETTLKEECIRCPQGNGGCTGKAED